MASALVGLRYFVFGLFIICSTILCSVGVWNLSLVQNRTFYNAQVSVYMIFLGAFGLLCIFPLIFLDLIRRNAFTSRIWVEFIWIAIFWVMELSGAAALSTIVPNNHCARRRGRIATNTCLSGQVLLGFAWAITLTLLAYMVTLAIYTIVHYATDSNVLNETVRGYPWFAGQSTLSSSPPSPVLEKGMGAPSLKHPHPKTAFDPSSITRERSPFDDPIQPVPTFDNAPEESYQPAQRTYEGLQFATVEDSPRVIEPAFTRPREAPKPPVRVQSLYPEHMQAQLSTEARNNLTRQMGQLEGYEPSPIRDWPKSSRNNGTTNGYGRRQPPAPLPHINTEASASIQKPLPSISPNQRSRLSGTANISSPASPYKLGSPVRGHQRTGSARKLPPPPLNLDGISNISYHARR